MQHIPGLHLLPYATQLHTANTNSSQLTLCLCCITSLGYSPCPLVDNTFGFKGGQFLGVSMDSTGNRFIVSGLPSWDNAYTGP